MKCPNHPSIHWSQRGIFHGNVLKTTNRGIMGRDSPDWLKMNTTPFILWWPITNVKRWACRFPHDYYLAGGISFTPDVLYAGADSLSWLRRREKAGRISTFQKYFLMEWSSKLKFLSPLIPQPSRRSIATNTRLYPAYFQNRLTMEKADSIGQWYRSESSFRVAREANQEEFALCWTRNGIICFFQCVSFGKIPAIADRTDYRSDDSTNDMIVPKLKSSMLGDGCLNPI